MTDSHSSSLNRFSVAPMLDWTDRHARFFLRLLSKNTLLYTEMVTTGAILHGDAQRFLQFNQQEHPIALQLGGSNPIDLAKCCTMASDYGYDEINLNVGCPSDRVQSGMFGACLMAKSDLVAECFTAMQEASQSEVTIKCRTGIDDLDSFEFLQAFIATVADSGCKTFVIHARKAWLSGLSPKQNREIPELDYERVYKIKQLFPQLNIAINGGITALESSLLHLQHVDGVMMGREAYNNPFVLADVDEKIFACSPNLKNRHDIIEAMLPYIEKEMAKGVKLNHISRHILGLYNGLKGAKAFRRHISENAHKKDADINVIIDAMKHVQDS
ncbi:MAG: tRNA dihydrouridine(20/20a) synthase DusA [Pseudomonadales bacterium]|nr:tRNA dihydrouridine(20/20a) synthase DusA [Pseudomonadales bacterium]